MTVRILVGDVRERLKELAGGSVHCCVTSPPFFGLRDYGTGQWLGGDPECDHKKGPPAFSERALAKWSISPAPNTNHAQEGFRSVCRKCGAHRVDRQIGLEETVDDYVTTLVAVCREIKRVLRDDGTFWLNLGDGYNGSGGAGGDYGSGGLREGQPRYPGRREGGLKPKDLCMVPARVALALQADGWYLRSEISWIKVAPMPESVLDRPTSATEKIYLFSKKPRYFYDQQGYREPIARSSLERIGQANFANQMGGSKDYGHDTNSNRSARGTLEHFAESDLTGRNLWNWWALAPESFAGAHFAVFPTELPRRCIKLGTSEKGCCPECGKPWRRVIERQTMVLTRSGRAEQMGEFGRTQASGTMISPPTTTTTGWQPSCTCEAGEPRPCVVLDPFLGSGTTALVADRLGRDAVGIELNPSYAAMAKARIEGDAPMLARVELGDR